MKRGVMLAIVAVLMTSTVLSTTATAQQRSDADLQRSQVEALRLQLANSIHLKAFDLLDELVYGWTKTPPFAVDTAVVVADVVVPLGFGSGLEALIENHLADLLLKHPETRVRLAHCPSCAALTVHSDSTGTVISRGVDNPAALGQAGKITGAKQALFLDFEAEGSALVLRARMTTLDDNLTITMARTLSSSTSSAALLRSGDRLVSADEAREQYLDALQGTGPVAIPVRLQLVQFAQPTEGGLGIPVPPLLWIQTGIELHLSHARDWSANIIVGGIWIPQLYNGVMLEARVNRLLTGTAVSLTQPNLYLFAGGVLTTVTGPTALLMRDQVPGVADLIAAATGVAVQITTYPALTTGLDLRIGNRLGMTFFMQFTPTLGTSPNIGTWVNSDLISFGNAIGGEVSLWF